jgi:hypothetical protein
MHSLEHWDKQQQKCPTMVTIVLLHRDVLRMDLKESPKQSPGKTERKIARNLFLSFISVKPAPKTTSAISARLRIGIPAVSVVCRIALIKRTELPKRNPRKSIETNWLNEITKKKLTADKCEKIH